MAQYNRDQLLLICHIFYFFYFDVEIPLIRRSKNQKGAILCELILCNIKTGPNKEENAVGVLPSAQLSTLFSILEKRRSRHIRSNEII
jgi:hypothetical protein